MVLDPVWVAGEAAAKLKITEAQALPSAQAAVDYIATYTGLEVLPDDDAQLNIGSVLMAMRIYQDAATPNGSTSSFDGGFTVLFTPKHLYSHLDEYFRNLPGATHGFA